jgi:hypothetical protein
MLTLLAASALQVCVIAYANDRPSTQEIRTHEIAHCAGWEHKRQEWKTPPKGYKAEKPPKGLVYRGKLESVALPTKQVQALCEDVTGHASYGCQWWE